MPDINTRVLRARQNVSVATADDTVYTELTVHMSRVSVNDTDTMDNTATLGTVTHTRFLFNDLLFHIHSRSGRWPLPKAKFWVYCGSTFRSQIPKKQYQRSYNKLTKTIHEIVSNN